jgi:hypothetical protein
MLWKSEESGFDSWYKKEIFRFSIPSRVALGFTQLPVKWVPGAVSLEAKRSPHEADHSHPSAADIKYTSTLPYVFMAWRLINYAQV